MNPRPAINIFKLISSIIIYLVTVRYVIQNCITSVVIVLLFALFSHINASIATRKGALNKKQVNNVYTMCLET
jgi:hypothetical protein